MRTIASMRNRYNWSKTIRLNWSNGGLFFTAMDYIRFLRVFINQDESVLSSQAIRSMLSPQASGGGGTYGLGWKLDGEFFGHTGSVGTYAFGHTAKQPEVAGVLFIQYRQHRERKLLDGWRNEFARRCLSYAKAI